MQDMRCKNCKYYMERTVYNSNCFVCLKIDETYTTHFGGFFIPPSDDFFCAFFKPRDSKVDEITDELNE